MALGAGLSRLVAVAPSVNPSASRSKYFSHFLIPPSGAGLLPRQPSGRSLFFRCPLPRLADSTSGYRGRVSLAAMSSSSSFSSYEVELAAAKKAASLAAHLCQKVQKSILQSDVQSKADRSPVTVADYGSQALVSLVLRMELPSKSFSLVAEEDSGDLRKDGAQETLKRITKLVNETITTDGTYNLSLSEVDVLDAIDSGKSEGGPYGRHWVLDPIDGTKGFVRGDQYAIALAMLDEGKVVLGVLACPNLPLTPISSTYEHSSKTEFGCLFSASIGFGTKMESLDGSTTTKVHISTVEEPADASFFESFEAAHSMHDLSSCIAEKLGVKAPPVRIDSQAKYGALARGDGAIYLRFPHKGYREKIWDHAAGFIVVSEAGGVVTDASGNDLNFSKGRYLDLDTGIICTNKKLMPLLLKAVQDSLKEKLASPSTL
ncbi:SAL1 phosphatase isoform X1 [Dendrobium catenatum]|uniref:3'(2'),5'-bisphosphate nucleotidase n=1 Tax=Dendrobium catenatum TaxID=906689 RepID=A0A2I0VA06_9ASPA|nr:SAL1 phosphatase isoform X1 [Dendrobium catenatum]PKU60234.1 3'(2'),5'-bisphosphate nucleotidase [Dendrobium catenatum]